MFSLCGFLISLSSRLLGLYFIDKVDTFPNYQEFDTCNLTLIIGHLLFHVSTYIKFKNLKTKRILTLVFTGFLLLGCLYVSYVNSMHNTKNTLTVALIGVFLVGVFFVLERHQIIVLVTIFFLVFWLSIINGKISFLDKMLNACAGFTLAIVLLFISRYTYYTKSLQFVRFKELEERNLEVELLNAQKNDVLAYVMHDLRGPLGNIKMLNEFIEEKHPDLQEVALIKKASNQAKNIINDLLDALKGTVGELAVKEDNLNEFAELVVNKWRNTTNRTITLAMPTSPIHVALNKAKMERVLDNLLQNAIKFSPVNTAIEVQLQSTATTATLTVHDFGIGIPANKQKDIFKQFTSFSRTGLAGEKSIGIGLHISKKIVEQHKGTIVVSSTEGNGATFTITLPKVNLA